MTYSSNNSKVKADTKGQITIVANFAGKAAITITAAETDHYKKATKTIAVTVNAAPVNNVITASNVKKTMSTKSQSFSLGAKNTGNTKMTYKSDSSSVKVDAKGKVTINAKFIGKATITITSAATAKYKKAEKKITITVNPTSTSLTKIKNSAKGKASVTWKKNSYVSGYEVRYSLKSNFASGVKSKTVSGQKKTTVTLTKLKKGKKYYVQIRTYKKVGSANYYSAWSKSKAIKITK